MIRRLLARYNTLLIASAVFCLPLISLHAQTVAPGLVIENPFPTATFNLPLQIVFLLDGRSLVVEKGGVVWTMTVNGTKLSTPFIDLSAKVLNNGDRGLLGVAIDPDFTVNRWVYFLYTVDPDSNDDDSEIHSFGRLERYQASSGNPNVADLTTRQILIGGSWPTGIPIPRDEHSTGAIRFAQDKSLLFSMGDAGRVDVIDRGGFDPDAFGPGKTDSSQDIGAFRAQSLNSFNGKILRVDKETGNGLSSNPYWDGNAGSIRSRVWAYGLRNPYRFVIRPGSGSTNQAAGQPGTLYIGDVGLDATEDYNIARQGGINFGWPCFEGPNALSGYQAVMSTFHPNPNVLCGAALNPENPAPKTPPDLWWSHNSGSQSHPIGWVGSCAIGGAFYIGTSYPARYRNSVFVGDFASNWIRSVQVDTNDNVVPGGDTMFVTNAQGPVSIEADPLSGDLFFVGIVSQQVYRIRSASGNHSPVLTANLTPTSGLSPLTVTVTASASDYDGDSLSYKWNFGNGDSSTIPNTTYIYTNDGVYTATITVTDGHGGGDIRLFNVVVGQTAPEAHINAPADSSAYPPNTNVSLVASVVDTASGPVTYRWDVDILHNAHIHPSSYISFGQTSSFLLVDHLAGDYYRYQVRLSVTRGAITVHDTVYVFSTSSPPPTPTVTVLSPNGGESWQATSVQDITWSATLTTLVNISYKTATNGAWTTIAINVSAPLGVYAWTIPNVPTTHARVRIVDAQSAPVVDSSNTDFTITSPPPNQDITDQGTAVAFITNPTGGGNHSLSVIKDGVFPPVGSTDDQQQYDTDTGGGSRPLDWIGYTFTSSHAFTGVTFQEGKNFGDGGFFTTLGVQVLIGSTWTDVQNFLSTPSYSGGNGIHYETFNLSFTPVVGTGIRIAGIPGGSSHFISVGELRALVNDNPETIGVLTPNGGESWLVGSSHAITWSSSQVTAVDLFYSTAPAGSWIPITTNVTASPGSYSWLVPNAPTSQARVRVVDAQNSSFSDSSDAYFAITAQSPPPFPQPVSPQNNASNVSINPLIVWNDAATATSYRLLVASDSNFVGVVFDDSTITDTAKQVAPALANSTQYFWKVNAKNGVGHGPFSSVSRFLTAPDSSTTTISISIGSGWNMISNPLSNPVPDDSAKHLFPTLLSPHVFEFSGNYQSSDKMSNGKGYWGKFPGAIAQSITGVLRVRDSISVVAGWNIVGSISDTVDTNTIVSVPAGLRTSNWFGYAGGYSATARIFPGRGYWVKANGAGKFVLESPSVARPEMSLRGSDAIEGLNSITISDCGGGAQTLFFGADSHEDMPIMFYTMPPTPPAGAFDARFQTAGGGSIVQTHGSSASELEEFTIAIQSNAYPVTLTWNVKSASYVLSDGLEGRAFRTEHLRGEGSLRIDDRNVNRILLKFLGEAQLPVAFSLSQSYPNPFNPSTTIYFTLPKSAHVELKIFNTLGQEIATMVNKEMAAGMYSTQWNASDVASGVYIYRLSADGFVETKRMLLMK